MAFKLISAVRLDVLAEELAKNVFAGTDRIFDSPKIVVQSKGMQRWLSLKVAEVRGISANIEYLFFNGLFEEILYQPCSEELGFAAELAGREQLKWLVFKLLGEVKSEPVFRVLNNYIDNEEFKQLQLSQKIADLYDVYALYRPDWLRAWAEGDTVREEINRKTEEWLGELWRRLKECCEFSSFAELSDTALEWLKNAAGIVERLPGAVHVFGVSSLPPRFMELLDALSRKIDVYFYYLEISTEYWGLVRAEKDILRRAGSNFEIGNPLLAALGQRNRDFFNLLVEYASTAGVEETCIETVAASVQPVTILQQVQQDIRGMRRPQKKILPDDCDLSIVFHSCYGRMRQVEALYQSLLGEFEKNRELKPKDILVLTASIKDFVPYIKAVFGTVDYDSPEYIPYTISDRAVIDENRAGKILLGIMRLLEGRFKVSEVWNIFSELSTLQEWGVDEDGRDIILQWLNELSVHWGVDGEQREKVCGVFYEESSWKEAEERLLLGYALSTAEGLGFSLHSGREICGVDVAGENTVLDIWLKFITDMIELQKKASRIATAAGWLKLINHIIERMFAENDSQLEIIRGNIDEFAQLLESLDMEEQKISAEVFTAELEQVLSRTLSSSGFIMGGVTFCQFQPMRNIPAKIICMLGMDDAAFPRVDHPPTFDISRSERRLCDPSLRLDDQGVFLETLLSVEDKLQVFYNGNSLQDGSVLPAALPVQQLQEYLDSSYMCADGGKITDKITVNHPLQRFSPRYFLPGKNTGIENFQVYSKKDFEICRLILNSAGVQEHSIASRSEYAMAGINPPDTLELDELVNMFVNPARTYLQSSCGVRFVWLDEELPVDEDVFKISESYITADYLTEILELRLQGMTQEEIRRRVLLDRKIPAGNFGEDYFEDCYSRTGAIYSVLASGYSANKSRLSGKIDFTQQLCSSGNMGNMKLYYDLAYPHDYEGGARYVGYTFSTVSWKVMLPLWQKHLVYSLVLPDSIEFVSVLYGADGREQVMYPRCEREEAMSYLCRYINGYTFGLVEPLPLFRNASAEYAVKYLKDNDSNAALVSARSRYLGGWNRGDVDDKYINRCFGNDFFDNTENTGKFEDAAEEYVLPVYQSAVSGRKSRKEK